LPRHEISSQYRRIAYERAAQEHFEIQDVSIRTADGIVLRGWFVKPQIANGSSAILLHGVSDNRLGMARYGELLLKNGYSVLLPDARDHGESDGQLASYGVREAEDVHEWVTWINKTHSPNCVYGLGESMGAAILLQSLVYENRFCAIVAESAFADFREGADDRVSHYLDLPTPITKWLFRPAIEVGIVYARARYGLDLSKASPRSAVIGSKTPVLLIHGAADINIRPQNSRIIHQASLGHTELWEVPHAAHCGAWSADPQGFESRLLAWFAQFNRSPLATGT
jgi:hypothetical protein